MSKIIRVWSPGESDFGYETILYLDGNKQPKTAVLAAGKIVCRSGWSHFDVEWFLHG